MPKKKPNKPPGELTTDPAVIADLQRQDEYGNTCEGETDGRVGVVTKVSLAAFRRKQEREREGEMLLTNSIADQ